VCVEYHESLPSQAKTSRIYDSRHKTISAGSRANEEQLELHKIDGSGIVSKYVGKTEKRLNKISLKAWPYNFMCL